MPSPKFTFFARIKADDELTPALTRLRRRANRTFRAIGRSSGRAAKSIAKIGTVGAAAAAAGLAKLTLDYAKQADELAKFSKQTQFGVESLQELEFAAERAGVGAETMRKAIEKLSKNVGDAKADTGTLKTILDKTSPSLLEAAKNTTDTEQALMLFLGAIRELPDASQKAALANAAFGRSGLKVIRLADDGADALEAYREEARRYGLITAAQAAAAENFANEQTNLTASLVGLRNEIGGELLPVLTPYVKRLKEWVVANRGLISSQIVDTVKGLADGIASVDWSNVISQTGALFDNLGLVVGALADVVKFMTSIDDMVAGKERQLSTVFGTGIEGVQGGRGFARHVLSRQAQIEASGGAGPAAINRAMATMPRIGRSIDPQQSFNSAAQLMSPAAEVSISFANAPPGMAVDSIRTKDGAKVSLKTGPRKVGR